MYRYCSYLLSNPLRSGAGILPKHLNHQKKLAVSGICWHKGVAAYTGKLNFVYRYCFPYRYLACSTFATPKSFLESRIATALSERKLSIYVVAFFIRVR